MRSLILDCSKGMSVYVLKGDEVESFIDENQKKHTDELLVCVDNLLSKLDLKVNDLDFIGVCVGPGSFTGIRVAVSICKGLAITNDIKICTASNFEIYSFGNIEKAFYILDGFSDNIYVREIDGDNYFDDCIKIDEFIEKYKSKSESFKVYIQSEKMQNLLKINQIQSDFAKNNTILCFIDKFKNSQFVNLNEINPIYLRASQAEIERTKRLSGKWYEWLFCWENEWVFCSSSLWNWKWFNWKC